MSPSNKPSDCSQQPQDINQNNCKPVIKEILYDGYFYDVTNFVSKHPGGIVIDYYTKNGDNGYQEDATMAMLQFHNRSKKRVDMILKTLQRRPAQDSDIQMDAVKLKRYREMSKDVVDLYNEAEKEGLFNPNYPHIVAVAIEILVWFFLGAYIINHSENWFIKLIGSIIVGFGMGRCGLLQHEGGHNSLTGIPKIDKLLQNIYYGLFMSMSGKYWVENHSTHHAMPQRIQHDYDMELLPAIAIFPEAVTNAKDPAQNNFFTRNQVVLAPLFLMVHIPIYALIKHPQYIYKNKCWDEAVALIAHYIIAYYSIGFWPYMIAKSFMGIYLLNNFSINHSHLPATNEPHHWLEYCLIYTANCEHNWFNDWWTILLNYQIEHHLFPTMCQRNLRHIVPRVKALAKKYNLPYETYTLWEGEMKVLKNIWNMQQHVRKVNEEHNQIKNK